MAAAVGACLNHIARESPDTKRLAQFYTEVFGFEQLVAPKFAHVDVIRLKLGSFFLHLIERDPSMNLPEYRATSAVDSPKNLIRGHQPLRRKELKCTRIVNQMGRRGGHSSLIQTETDRKLAMRFQCLESGH